MAKLNFLKEGEKPTKGEHISLVKNLQKELRSIKRRNAGYLISIGLNVIFIIVISLLIHFKR